jgi:drug/metabolite transporter (DMT)-like permease
MPAVRSSGTLLCLLSAIAFGAMGVLGKLAYENGATVGTLLSVRFVLAAALFWVIVGPRAVRGVGRRDVVLALALGACGYAAQAGGYFAALERIDVSVLALLIYTYPAIVAAAAVAIGRERLDRRKLWALAFVLVGLVLLLASAASGDLDPLGTALGLVTACIYSAYILTSQGVAGRVRPLTLAALVCTGAAVTLTVGSTLLGQLRPGDLTAAGWGWLACLAVVSTVAAISLFFAGLSRVGPTAAAILSTLEPVTTVVLAYLVFGEVLAGVQLLGGALVLGGVVVLSLNPRVIRGSRLSRRAPRRVGGLWRANRRAARAAEQRAPHVGEAGGQRGEELGERAGGVLAHHHGLDLRNGAGAGLVAPGDVQVLAADDLSQVHGQDDVGFRVVDGQMKVRHLGTPGGGAGFQSE